jgi:hypothetical protein
VPWVRIETPIGKEVFRQRTQTIRLEPKKKFRVALFYEQRWPVNKDRPMIYNTFKPRETSFQNELTIESNDARTVGVAVSLEPQKYFSPRGGRYVFRLPKVMLRHEGVEVMIKFYETRGLEEKTSSQRELERRSSTPPSKRPRVLNDNNTNGTTHAELLIVPGDVDAVVKIFNREAILDRNFFRAQVQAADWPERLKGQLNDLWSGNAWNDAHLLVNVLVARNRYDWTHQHRDDTYLGRLLLSLLESVGSPSDQILARIIIKYDLLNDTKDIEVARARLPEGM